jgi:hypothetical protein
MSAACLATKLTADSAARQARARPVALIMPKLISRDELALRAVTDCLTHSTVWLKQYKLQTQQTQSALGVTKNVTGRYGSP